MLSILCFSTCKRFVEHSKGLFGKYSVNARGAGNFRMIIQRRGEHRDKLAILTLNETPTGEQLLRSVIFYFLSVHVAHTQNLSAAELPALDPGVSNGSW